MHNVYNEVNYRMVESKTSFMCHHVPGRTASLVNGDKLWEWLEYQAISICIVFACVGVGVCECELHVSEISHYKNPLCG